MISVGHCFSAREREQLFTAIEASLGSLASEDEFRNYLRERIRPLLPHGMMIAALGRLTVDAVRIDHVIGIDYPQEFIDQVEREISLEKRPVVAHWLANRKPILLDPALHGSMLSEMERREIDDFELGNLAIHGHIDISGRMASYFSFARVPSPLEERYAQILEVLAPHIHAAVMKVIPRSSGLVMLSKKELEALRWVVDGRTNRAIAAILGKSDLTVRNQLHQLFRKLGATNRAEAIRRADELGLLARQAP